MSNDKKMTTAQQRRHFSISQEYAEVADILDELPKGTLSRFVCEAILHYEKLRTDPESFIESVDDFISYREKMLQLEQHFRPSIHTQRLRRNTGGHEGDSSPSGVSQPSESSEEVRVEDTPEIVMNTPTTKIEDPITKTEGDLTMRVKESATKEVTHEHTSHEDDEFEKVEEQPNEQIEQETTESDSKPKRRIIQNNNSNFVRRSGGR